MQDRANEGSEVSGPHMTLKYRDRSILDDAVTLIVHHMKRQTSLHKEDKQSIKELLYHFMPDMFHMPRGELSDDEQDKDDDSQYMCRRLSSFLGALKSLKKKSEIILGLTRKNGILKSSQDKVLLLIFRGSIPCGICLYICY